MRMRVAGDDTDTIRALLAAQRFAVLSTHDRDGHPHVSLVAFHADPQLAWVVFCTLRATRKYSNLTVDPRAALLVDDRTNTEVDLHLGVALSILGTCQDVRDGEEPQLRDMFISKHPGMQDFVDSPDCAIIKLDVRSVHLVRSLREMRKS